MRDRGEMFHGRASAEELEQSRAQIEAEMREIDRRFQENNYHVEMLEQELLNLRQRMKGAGLNMLTVAMLASQINDCSSQIQQLRLSAASLNERNAELHAALENVQNQWASVLWKRRGDEEEEVYSNKRSRAF